MIRCLSLPLFFTLSVAGYAQYAYLQSAPKVELPSVIDGNTAAMWTGGKLHIFHSSGVPTRSKGPNQFSLGGTEAVDFNANAHKPVWFEAVWRDSDGTLFLWYHHEPGGVCSGNKLTAPKIGAAISYDNGKTVEDLGIVLESGDPADCNAKNGFFAGGHGDFSVVPDRDRNFFYFFFTNYNGALEEQGVAVARLAFPDRFQPAGAVRKFYNNEWTEPGLGGHMTAVFPASTRWQQSDANSFWGPSIHWNTHLEKYVILMNQTCCSPGWPQAGISISYNSDLANPAAWISPYRILDTSQIGHSPGYYPQVLGLGDGETDSLAGQSARLYVHGFSNWEITFSYEPPEPGPPEICPESAFPACPDSQEESSRRQPRRQDF